MLRGIFLILHNRTGQCHGAAFDGILSGIVVFGNDRQIAAELFSWREGRLLRERAFPIVTGQLHVRAIRCTRFVI